MLILLSNDSLHKYQLTPLNAMVVQHLMELSTFSSNSLTSLLLILLDRSVLPSKNIRHF